MLYVSIWGPGIEAELRREIYVSLCMFVFIKAKEKSTK